MCITAANPILFRLTQSLLPCNTKFIILGASRLQMQLLKGTNVYTTVLSCKTECIKLGVSRLQMKLLKCTNVHTTVVS